MSTRSQGTGSAADRAARLREAGFVRIVARADGDGLAAAGVLARSLADVGVPFQVSAARTAAGLADRVARADATATDRDRTVLVGNVDADPDPDPDPVPDVEADVQLDDPEPASVAAWRIAEGVGAADPLLALAGALAAGATPTVEADPAAPVLAAASDADLVDRRPGVGVPTADPVDGLAHSTLVHAPFSGDPDAVRETLGALADRFHPEPGESDDGVPAPDDEDRRRLASALALTVAGAPGASDAAGTSVERALRPHATGEPFATVEGYADVLDAAARESPGAGIGLALGHGARDAALSAWRDHARAAHDAVRSAETSRYDGLLVARVDADAPVEAVARLARAYRSPEPIAAAVAPDELGVAAGDDRGLAEIVRAVVDSVGGEAGGTGRRGYARVENDPAVVVAALREALA